MFAASNQYVSARVVRSDNTLMTIHHSQCANVSIVRLDGALRAPVSNEFSRRVKTLLDRGERRIVVDLSRVVAVDAAGVGELVRAFNATCAAGGVLRITRANRQVRRILRVAGVLPLLSARTDDDAFDDSLAVGA